MFPGNNSLMLHVFTESLISKVYSAFISEYELFIQVFYEMHLKTTDQL